jgi:hypothetical protein
MENSFQRYENLELATASQGEISEADKQALKYNLRKQDLFEQTLFFSTQIFELVPPLQLSQEQLKEFVCALLSIVLSHHYQKRDIKNTTR